MDWNDVNKMKPLASSIVIVKNKNDREIRAKYVPRWNGWKLDNLDSKCHSFGKVTHWISESEYKRVVK